MLINLKTGQYKVGPPEYADWIDPQVTPLSDFADWFEYSVAQWVDCLLPEWGLECPLEH